MNAPNVVIDETLNRRYIRWAFFLNGASLLTMITLRSFVARDDWFFETACFLFGVSGMVFIVTLVICVLTVLGHPPVMTLVPLVASRRERARWREMRQRPELSDEEFYERFYRDTDIPKDVPLRLRAVYAEQVGMNKVLPQDRFEEFLEDIDFGELLHEVADEFEVEFSDDEAHALADEGTFDALVHNLAQRPISS